MKTRTRVRWITAACAAVVVASGFAVQYRLQAQALEDRIRYGYMRAMSEVTRSVEEMNTALHKASCVESPALMVTLAAKAWQESMNAVSALSELPVAQRQLEQTGKFLSQTGDYAMYVAKQAVGGNVSQEHLDALAQRYHTAESLARQLYVLEAEFSEGMMDYGQLSVPDSGDAQLVSELETAFPDQAELIYDGPMSEHVLQQSPRLLESLEPVSVQQAAAAAEQFCGATPEYAGPGDGVIPCYYFYYEADGQRWDISVTQQGGMVLSACCSYEPAAAAALDRTAAETAAERFVAAYLGDHFTRTYSDAAGDITLVNFAATQDGVTLYPDLIKVGVRAGDGAVVRYDAVGYVMNHTDRALTIPQQTPPVPEGVEDRGLALIPTGGGSERLCREYLYTDRDGGHYLLYTDAVTGEQIQILLLVEQESGTLTI